MNTEEPSRITRFRQFKKEIRGNERFLIVGIDIAKDTHYGFMGTATGKTVLKSIRIDNNATGFEHLSARVQFILDRDGYQEVVFGVEPTSVYHKPLAEYLINQGHLAVYVTNEAIKKNRFLLDGRWDKNDQKDSANVADLISQGKCHFYDLPDRGLRDIRSLLSFRKRLKRQHHGMRVRIRNNLVAQYFPELDKHWMQAEAENLAIIERCLSPVKIRGMQFDEFFKVIAPRPKGLSQFKRLQNIWEAAAESIGCESGVAMELEARVLVDSIRQVKEQIAKVDKKIEHLCLQYEEYKYLLSIPGFGPYISAVVLASIGNPHRFDNISQLNRLSGFDLNANRSGKKSDAAVPVISKKGKADLRYALYQAALIASSRTKAFGGYFHKLLDGRQREKGIRTKMRVKLAVKLLAIAWTLMKKKEPFDPDYLKLQ